MSLSRKERKNLLIGTGVKLITNTTDFAQLLRENMEAYKSQREITHRLLCSALYYVEQDHNLTPLNNLMQALNDVRIIGGRGIMNWIFFATLGDTGEVDKEDKAVVDPEKSILLFDTVQQTFSLKGLASTDKKERQEELVLRRNALVKAMVKAFNVKFWEFMPARQENPYRIGALYNALSRALNNADKVSTRENFLLRELYTVCVKHNVTQVIEKAYDYQTRSTGSEESLARAKELVAADKANEPDDTDLIDLAELDIADLAELDELPIIDDATAAQAILNA